MSTRKAKKTVRVTKTMVERALDIYMDAMDFGHLAGPFEEHKAAMRKVLKDAHNGYRP